MGKLKGYRVMANLTQKDMANVIGMHYTSYNSKESQKTQFTLSEMKRIQAVISEKLERQISLEELFC